jgi:TRAP-type C4-dicarboxylate transport system permease small subunit
MASLKKYDSFNEKVSLVLEGIGLAAMILMVFITTIDVAGAKLFLKPIFGALDAVSLLQLIAIAFAASITLITGRHIEVEFLTELFPKGLRYVVDLLIKLICFTLFLVLLYYMVIYAHHLQVRGETTPTARIALYPFAYGVALACIPVCMVYISLIVKCFKRVIGNEF